MQRKQMKTEGVCIFGKSEKEASTIVNRAFDTTSNQSLHFFGGSNALDRFRPPAARRSE